MRAVHETHQRANDPENDGIVGIDSDDKEGSDPTDGVLRRIGQFFTAAANILTTRGFEDRLEHRDADPNADAAQISEEASRDEE